MQEEKITWIDIEKELQNHTFPDRRNTVILFGAGNMGQLEKPLLTDDLLISAFCDNDPRKQGQKIGGITCIAPQDIRRYENPFVLVSTLPCYPEIAGQLAEIGVQCCTVDAYAVWKKRDLFSTVYQWLDDVSREVYARVLLSRIQGDKSQFSSFCTDHQYFALPQFRFCESKEVFVDCGAFTGENIETFLTNVSGLFQRVYAFEPNPAAFAAMERRLSNLQNIWLAPKERFVLERKIVVRGGGHSPILYRQTGRCHIFSPMGKRRCAVGRSHIA